MMEYFHFKKAKHHTESAEKEETPVLNEEDEAFLNKITTEEEPPPLPARPLDLPETGDTKGNDAQVALMNGADRIPLPDVPDTPEGIMPGIGSENTEKGKGKETDSKAPFRWSFLRRDSRDSRRRAAAATATDLDSIAQGLKGPDAKVNEDEMVTPHEANKEEEEMTSVLEQLNLAAVNNRVFSISKESQELLRKFTLVLKDLVNGVPTAYDDLESLLTNSENQIQKSYHALPSFLQKLIEQIPTKFTGSFGPEILAAAAERQGLKSEYLNSAAGVASKLGLKARVPSLKDLVTKPGAVASMLKTIMNFLKTRFPAFMGMNVLWSLALFLLLFVFWYCHKRGRETRLEKERLLTEAEIAQLDKEVAEDPNLQTSAGPTTTAPEGAPIEEVQAGMKSAAAESEKEEAEKPKTGEASYAPGGSLAKDEAARKKKAEEERKAAEEKDSEEKKESAKAKKPEETKAQDKSSAEASESSMQQTSQAGEPASDHVA